MDLVVEVVLVVLPERQVVQLVELEVLVLHHLILVHQ
jgi:hypothetical protein